MARSALRALVVAALVGAPSALACTCVLSPADVNLTLAEALTSADAVFRGVVTHVSKVDPASRRQRFTFRVDETFKGPPRKERVLEGNASHSCGRTFDEGAAYLVYADGDAAGEKPMSASYCTRVLELADAQRELDWLRTRKPVPVPVAMRRRTVSCEECELSPVAQRLACGERSCLALPFPEVAAALDAKRSFWSHAARDDTRQTRRIFGSTTTGRLFVVSQSSAWDCEGSVTLKWCSALKLTAQADRPMVECVGGVDAPPPCDEARTRKSEWSAVGAWSSSNCEWKFIDGPRCELTAPPTPLASKAPTAPGLHCRQRGGTYFECTLVPDAAATPVDEWPTPPVAPPKASGTPTDSRR